MKKTTGTGMEKRENDDRNRKNDKGWLRAHRIHLALPDINHLGYTEKET